MLSTSLKQDCKTPPSLSNNIQQHGDENENDDKQCKFLTNNKLYQWKATVQQGRCPLSTTVGGSRQDKMVNEFPLREVSSMSSYRNKTLLVG